MAGASLAPATDAPAGLARSFLGSSSSQAAHLRLSCAGAGEIASSGLDMRITWSATWSASCSSGSLTCPTTSFACMAPGRCGALNEDRARSWFVRSGENNGNLLKFHATPGVAPWNLRGGDVLLSVRLTPKASRDEIAGVARLADGRSILKVRVRAAPEDGKANGALRRLVAKTLGVPARAVRLEWGAGGRVKTLCLQGDVARLMGRLERLRFPD